MARDDTAVVMDPPPPYKQALPKRATSCLPVVDQGCCCCTLRTCNLVQGWLALLGSIYNVLRTIWSMAVMKQGIDDIVCDDGEFGCSKMTIRVRSGMEFGENPVVSTAMVISLIMGIATIVVSALFLKGIRENKPSLMVHYIRMSVASIILFLLISIAVCVVLANVAVFLFMIVIGCGLPTYFLICANSLYIKMVEELENPSVVTVPVAGGAVLPPGYGFSPAPTAPGAPYAPVPTAYPPVPAPCAQPPPQYAPAYAPPAPLVQPQDEYPSKKVPPQD